MTDIDPCRTGCSPITEAECGRCADVDLRALRDYAKRGKPMDPGAVLQMLGEVTEAVAVCAGCGMEHPVSEFPDRATDNGGPSER